MRLMSYKSVGILRSRKRDEAMVWDVCILLRLNLASWLARSLCQKAFGGNITTRGLIDRLHLSLFPFDGVYFLL